MDARDWPEPSDAIVTDLPYGKGLEASEEVIRGILEQARSLAPVAVFIAGSDLTDWLRAVGPSRGRSPAVFSMGVLSLCYATYECRRNPRHSRQRTPLVPFGGMPLW